MFKLHRVALLICLFTSLTFVQKLSGQTESIAIYSSSMEKEIPAMVILPESYHQSQEKYPVVYLLHGSTGSHSDWIEQMPDSGLLIKLANRHNALIVLAEGEPFGFYLDSPHNPKSQFKTHIAKELVPHIDHNYRSLPNKESRAISGFSMGGHGAFYLAWNYPELFGAVGILSGAVCLTIKEWHIPMESRAYFFDAISTAIGTENDDLSWFAEHAAIQNIDKIKEHTPALILDSGTEDFLLKNIQDFRKKLLDAGIKHEYTERPGAHNWQYVQTALPQHFLFFEQFFKASNH